MSAGNPRVGFRLPAAVHEELSRKAREMGTSPHALARSLVLKGLGVEVLGEPSGGAVLVAESATLDTTAPLDESRVGELYE